MPTGVENRRRACGSRMGGLRWKETVRVRVKRIEKNRGVRTDEQIDRKIE